MSEEGVFNYISDIYICSTCKVPVRELHDSTQYSAALVCSNKDCEKHGKELFRSDWERVNGDS